MIRDVSDIGIGSEFFLVFGAGYSPVVAKVKSIEVIPPSKYFEGRFRLWAEYEDFEGFRNSHCIDSYTEGPVKTAIGCYLKKKVAPVKKVSAWA